MQNQPNIMNQPNMTNFMNMLNCMKPMIFNPDKLDKRIIQTIVRENESQCELQLYKMFPKPKSIRFVSPENPKINDPDNICEVQVIHEHVLDIVENYSVKGSFAPNNEWDPVIMNTVSNEFTGSNFVSGEGIRDDIINMRTSYCTSVRSKSPYPLKENQSVYSKFITVIRPKNPTDRFQRFLPWPQTFRVNMITVPTITVTKLLENDKMTSEDYLKCLTTIDCVFKTAICAKHTLLILSPFVNFIDNIPVNDIIRIYNYCILKYGYHFKKIIVGVPPYYPKIIYDAFYKNIIRPQDIVTDIDDQYEEEEFKSNLINNKQPNQQIDPEQLQMFIKLVQSNPNFMNQVNSSPKYGNSK